MILCPGIKRFMVTRLSLLFLMATVGFACAHNKRSERTVLERASFDFHCPKDQIELIVIDEEGARNLASQIAAHGCEKKAVYIFYPDMDTWVINGSVSAAPTEHDPNAYHGKRKHKQEQRSEKKQNKKAKKATKKAEKEAKELEKPPVD
jgi:hypothetical protein